MDTDTRSAWLSTRELRATGRRLVGPGVVPLLFHRGSSGNVWDGGEEQQPSRTGKDRRTPRRTWEDALGRAGREALRPPRTLWQTERC